MPRIYAPSIKNLKRFEFSPSDEDELSTPPTQPSKKNPPVVMRPFTPTTPDIPKNPKISKKAVPPRSEDRVLSDEAIRRLCKLAEAKRISSNVFDTVRKVFRDVLIQICKNAFAIATDTDRLTTILPRHIRFATKSMGFNCPSEDAENVPFAKATFIKCIRTQLPTARMSDLAIKLLMTLISDIIYKWICSAVGLKAHSGGATLESRDLTNVKLICDDCPLLSFIS